MSGRSPGGGNGNPLQYSGLRNPMDRGAGGLQSICHRVGRDLAMKQQNPKKGLKVSFAPSLRCFIPDLECHRDYSGGFTPWEFLFRQINKKLIALKYVSSHWSPGQAQPSGHSLADAGISSSGPLRGRAGWPGWGAPPPQERLQSMQDDVVMGAKASHLLFTPELSWQEKSKDAESICEKTWKQRYSLPSASSGPTSTNSTNHGWNSQLV